MNNEIITVWTYTSGGDEWKCGPIAGVCSTEQLAHQAAQGSGWYGSNGVVRKHSAISFNGHIYLLSDNLSQPIDLDGRMKKIQDKLKEAALSKLTSEEKLLLGLK